MKKTIFFTIPLIVFLFASDALAYDAEYYTYGGFGAVMSAFRMVSNVFNNSEYKMLFFSIAVMGILFGGAGFYYNLLSGGKDGNGLAWLWPVMLGVVLYLGFVVPKGTLHVYDTVLNRYEPVPGIPNGINATLKILNTIEHGIVEIIEMSSSVLTYKEAAGGIGFDVLLKTTSSTTINDKYTDQTLKAYIQDCVLFEITRPGTTLKIEDINKSTGGNLWSLFGLANNPAIQTAYYSAAIQAGEATTCDNSYNLLNMTIGNPAFVEDMIKAKCSSAGVNVDNVIELQQCKTLIEKTVNYATSDTLSAEKFFQQSMLAAKLNEVVLNSGMDQAIATTASVSTVSAGYSMGIVANEYLPLIRAIITAVAVGLLPFLLLFVVTPIGGRIMGVAAGFFVWLTAWGVTDAITHQLATDFAYTYFEAARQNGSGYASLMRMPDAATKTLGLFGIIRISGMALATIVSKAIIPLAGHGLDMFAGQLSGTFQGQAQQASGLMTQDGTARAVQSYAGSMATVANAHQYDFLQRSGAQQLDLASATQKSLTANKNLGGDMASHGKTGAYAGVAAGSHMSGSTQMAYTQAGALNFGTDEKGLHNFNAFSAGNRVMTKEIADQVNEKHGTNFKEGMKLDWDTGTDGSVHNLRASGQLTDNLELSGFRQGFSVEKGANVTMFAGSGGNAGRTEIEGVIANGPHGGHKGHSGKMTLGDDGRIVRVQGDAGYQMGFNQDVNSSYVDMHTMRVGKDHRRMDNDVRESSRGTKIDSATALQRAINRDDSLISGFMNAKTKNQETAELSAIVSSLGAAIAPFESRTGTSRDYTEGKAGMSVGVGTPGFSPVKASIDGSAGVGGERSDSKQTNLVNQELSNLLSKAKSEASQKGYSGSDASKYVMDKLNTDILSRAENFINNNPDKFGASAGPAAIKEQANAMLRKMKGD